MNRLPTYYWDSCVFITLITNEDSRTDEEKRAMLDVWSKIAKKEAILITSAATRAEVLECTLTQEQSRNFESIFYRKNVEKAETSSRVWDLAHDIRNHHKLLKGKQQVKSVKLADAIHLATCILYDADELHTFDDQMLSLNGNVAGHNVVIRKPELPQRTLGLV